jgi:hypothetical protein
MMIDIRQPECVGCALAFLALCKVGLVSGFCVPCNMLKIASGHVGKVMDVCICVEFLKQIVKLRFPLAGDQTGAFVTALSE